MPVAYYYAHLAFLPDAAGPCLDSGGHGVGKLRTRPEGALAREVAPPRREPDARRVGNLLPLIRMEGVVPRPCRGRQGSHRVFRRLPPVDRLSGQARQQGATGARGRRARRRVGARSRWPAWQQGVSSQIAAPDLHIPGEGSSKQAETSEAAANGGPFRPGFSRTPLARPSCVRSNPARTRRRGFLGRLHDRVDLRDGRAREDVLLTRQTSITRR